MPPRRRPNLGKLIRQQQAKVKKAINQRIKLLKGVNKALAPRKKNAKKQQFVQAKAPPQQQPAQPPVGAQAPVRGRPANNTTADFYLNGNAPPAAPDVAFIKCNVTARFAQGQEASEGDTDFRWTHLLTCNPDEDIRDVYPASANRHAVYVPDENGTAFDVVFVELVNRGLPTAYKRVYLDRRAPTWPTNEL